MTLTGHNVNKSPTYVFHHIPKCGGTSMVNALAKWFNIVADYSNGWTGHISPKINTMMLQPVHCLCGHYEMNGNYLHERYPEIIGNRNFRIITFVRDPLQVRLSLYRYEISQNVCRTKSIEDHLFERTNYISNRFPATSADYRKILDRYFFIGILEQGQQSLDRLAQLIGKPRLTLPWKNQTSHTTIPEIDNLSGDLIARFKQENATDYLIYNYCLEKFNANIGAKQHRHAG